LLITRRIEGSHVLYCIYASHASSGFHFCSIQVDKSNENYYLGNDTVNVADDRQQEVISLTEEEPRRQLTGGPAQAILCCYDGWLRWAQASNLQR
jgi:hypothetical protein